MDFSWQEIRSGLQKVLEINAKDKGSFKDLKRFMKSVPRDEWGWGWRWRVIREDSLCRILQNLIKEKDSPYSQLVHIDAEGNHIHKVRITIGPDPKDTQGFPSDSFSKSLAIAIWKTWGSSQEDSLVGL